MADDEERVAWLIKGVHISTRQAAVAAAAARGQSVAEWLDPVVTQAVTVQKGDRIEEPLFPAPAVQGQGNQVTVSEGTLSVTEIATLVQAASTLASTEGVTGVTRRVADRVIRARLATALPPKPAKKQDAAAQQTLQSGHA